MLEQERLNGEAAPEKPKGSCLWWRLMPQKLKALIIAIIVLAIVALIFLIIVIVLAVRNRGEENGGICTTRECLESAELIREYMDPTADPCQDFAQFTCGGFYRKYRDSNQDPYSMLAKLTVQPIRNILEDTKSEVKSEAVFKMKVAYQSCVRDLSVDDEQTSVKKIIELLSNTVLDEWPPSPRSLDMNKILSTLLVLNVPSIFSFSLNANQIGTYFVLHINAPEAQTFDIPSYAENYKYLMKYMLGKLNYPNANLTAETIFQFEVQINNLLEDVGEFMDGEFNCRDMKRNFPALDWEKICSEIDRVLEAGHQLEPRLRFQVNIQTYMEKLNELIGKTPPGTISSYLIWKYIEWASDYVGPALATKKAVNSYARDIYESHTVMPVWKKCMTQVKSAFIKAMTYEYAKVMFDRERLDDVKQQLEYMKESFKKHVDKQNWLDEETKKATKEKVDHFQLTLGYPPSLLIQSTLDQSYESVKVDPDNFLLNLFEMLKFSTTQSWQHILTSEPGTWSYDPSDINAFNMQSKNWIIIPISILFPPFYQLQRPQYLNFGSLGSTLAHEMGHAFDSSGIRYSIDGTEGFFSEEMKKEYNRRAQCIVVQYSNFIFNQSGVVFRWNPSKSINDDIADGIGLLHSYLGYLDWEAKNGPEPGLPGLNYTNHQLFFILYAQQFCTTYTRSGAAMYRGADHSPNEFRIIGSIQNSVHFGDLFKCKAGASMNPKRKCNIWD